MRAGTYGGGGPTSTTTFRAMSQPMLSSAGDTVANDGRWDANGDAKLLVGATRLCEHDRAQSSPCKPEAGAGGQQGSGGSWPLTCHHQGEPSTSVHVRGKGSCRTVLCGCRGDPKGFGVQGARGWASAEDSIRTRKQVAAKQGQRQPRG